MPEETTTPQARGAQDSDVAGAGGDAGASVQAGGEPEPRARPVEIEVLP